MAALQALNEAFSGTTARDSRVTVLLVDEMDTMVTRTQDVLYNLFEWPLAKHARLAIIGIANTMDLPERLLPKIVSRLGDGRLAFKPYTMQQLRTIVSARVGEYSDMLTDAVQGFVCRKVRVLSFCVFIIPLSNTPLTNNNRWPTCLGMYGAHWSCVGVHVSLRLQPMHEW